MDQVNIIIQDIHNIIMKIPNWISGNNALGLCIFVFSGFFVFISFEQIWLTYKSADIVYLARLIESGNQVSPEAVFSYAKQTSAVVDYKFCRSDIVKSGLSVVLKNLDNQDLEVNYEMWDESLRDAERYLLHSLTCLPTNGNIWLRFAMVRLTIGEQPDELGHLMENAQRLAPSELNGIASRLKVWNRVSAATLAKASSSVLSDLVVVQKNKLNPEFDIRPSVVLQPYIKEAKHLSASAIVN